MDFQHLNYWQEKASQAKPETRLFINGEYCQAQDGSTFDIVNPAAQSTLAQVSRGKKLTLRLPFAPLVRCLSAVTGRRPPLQNVKPC